MTFFGSLQEVTVSNFFSEIHPKSPFQHQVGIKKKPREKDCLKNNSNRRGSRLVSRTKIIYGDFLKRSHFFAKVYYIVHRFFLKKPTIYNISLTYLFSIHILNRFTTQPLSLFKSEQPWCRSQSWINGEGCDRKGIQRET